MSELSSCNILGPVGFSVQILLGILSFLILIWDKRIREKPKRLWKVWGLDTSKQGCSQLISHFLNVALALHLSNEDADECVWYLATLLLDTTLGVFISYTILKIFESVLDQFKLTHYRTGNYFLIIMPEEQVKRNDLANKGKISTNTNLLKPIIKIDIKAWFIQLVIWIIVVCLAKTLLFALQVALKLELEAISGFVLAPLRNLVTLKLIVTIVVIPAIMNGLQFWIQDNFLKKTKFTVQEKKYVMSEMYVDEELAHLAQLEIFVNEDINKGSQNNLEMIQLPKIHTHQHNGYQQEDLVE